MGSDFEAEDSLRSVPPKMRAEWLKYKGINNNNYKGYFESFRPDSSNVRCIGRWPFGPSYEVDGKDSLIFLGSGCGVRIISVSDSTRPRQIGQISAQGFINELALKDTFLFIASNGIEIYKITNPSQPILISWINTPSLDFFIKDSFCYIVGSNSFKIYNISNIYNINQVGNCSDSGANVISISGNYAYTGNRWSMRIIDISNPVSPNVINSWAGYIWAIANRGNLCYVMVGGSNSNAFKILNVSNPLNIQELGTINNIAGWGICLKGFLAYLACSDATGGLPGLYIVDISDSINPAIVGNVDLLYSRRYCTNWSFCTLHSLRFCDIIFSAHII